MVTIISTQPVPVRYTLWETDVATHSKRRVWDCRIAGGSGVVDRNTLLTPQGVATEISDDALEKLMSIPAFTDDIEKGFIKVLKKTKARTVDADEEALKDMNLAGSGKPLTDKDLVKAGAQINEDGSIDISKGGEKAMALKRSSSVEEKHSKRGRRSA